MKFYHTVPWHEKSTFLCLFVKFYPTVPMHEKSTFLCQLLQHKVILYEKTTFLCLFVRFYTYGNMPLEQHLEAIEQQVLSHHHTQTVNTAVPLEPRWNKPVSYK